MPRRIGRSAILSVVLLAALGSIACDSGGGNGPTGSERQRVRVMTWNVYVGTPFEGLLGARSFEEVPPLVSRALDDILASDVPGRARAIAMQIDEQEPQLVGLQEVALVRTQTPGDFAAGNPAAAADTIVDFLKDLSSELAAHGLSYRVAATAAGADVELPAADGRDVRLTDREVVLVRDGVTVSNVGGGRFAARRSIDRAGLRITVDRAWLAVDAATTAGSLRFASTHLESQTAPEVQVAQAGELVAALDSSAAPVVLVGDFNSDASGGQTPTYGELLSAGFGDSWSEIGTGDSGVTCCQAPDLRNPTFQGTQRLDLVLVRGAVDPVDAEVVGRDPADRTAGGLWPSDHAGVVAELELR